MLSVHSRWVFGAREDRAEIGNVREASDQLLGFRVKGVRTSAFANRNDVGGFKFLNSETEVGFGCRPLTSLVDGQDEKDGPADGGRHNA